MMFRRATIRNGLFDLDLPLIRGETTSTVQLLEVSSWLYGVPSQKGGFYNIGSSQSQ